jgi:predicted amidohydrolase
MAERSRSGDRLYNSAVVLGPTGEVLGVYRKVHNQNEWPVFQSGDAFPVFATPVGIIGPFICADLHYPECTRSLVVQGARILTMTTAYPMDGDDPTCDPNDRAYTVQADALAMASQVWVMQANQVGQPAAPGAARYFGHSRIVSPFGEVAACGYEEALVTARVCVLGEIRRHERLKGPRLLRRRPELYGALTDTRL